MPRGPLDPIDPIQEEIDMDMDEMMDDDEDFDQPKRRIPLDTERFISDEIDSVSLNKSTLYKITDLRRQVEYLLVEGYDGGVSIIELKG